MASAGILSAVLASSCCIIPILALLAGSTGMASTFSWVEPIRPYLIVLSISVLSFAWYQKLKPKPEALDCCAAVEKPNFIQSKTFLVIITVLAVAMMSFPLYADLFFKPDTSEHKTLDQSNLIQVEFEISGMTCTGCETHIEQAVSKLQGIAMVNASYDSLNTIVRYDSIQTSLQQIQQAIGSTGYVITGIHKD
jgi:copper chaperone CopZ